jgi:hypothetical protein
MTLQFTAVFRKVPEGYIAFVEELPGANTQGYTAREVPLESEGSARCSKRIEPWLRRKGRAPI